MQGFFFHYRIVENINCILTLLSRPLKWRSWYWNKAWSPGCPYEISIKVMEGPSGCLKSPGYQIKTLSFDYFWIIDRFVNTKAFKGEILTAVKLYTSPQANVIKKHT